MQEGHWESARAAWDARLGVESARARFAVYALGAAAALRVFDLGAMQIASPTLQAAVGFGELALLVLTPVAFLRWIAHAVSFASDMSPLRLRWTASAAVWSFFMPIISLWRPYQVVRDLHDLLAPDGVPEPAPQPLLDGSGGYRDVVLKSAPPPRALPHVSIGAWWGAFVLTRLVGLDKDTVLAGVGTLVTVASATLAIFVVRAIDGRIAERYRRLRHASDDELEAWHIRA